MSKFFIINSETISEFFPIGVPVVWSTSGTNVENDDVLIGYNNRTQQFHCYYQAIKDASDVKLVKLLDTVQGVNLKDISNFLIKYLGSIMSPVSICEIDEALGIKLLKALYSAKCPIEVTSKHTTLLNYYKLLSTDVRIDWYTKYCKLKNYSDFYTSILTTDDNRKKQHSKNLADCVGEISGKRNIFEIDGESDISKIYEKVLNSDWNDKRKSKKKVQVMEKQVPL